MSEQNSNDPPRKRIFRRVIAKVPARQNLDAHSGLHEQNVDTPCASTLEESAPTLQSGLEPCSTPATHVEGEAEQSSCQTKQNLELKSTPRTSPDTKSASDASAPMTDSESGTHNAVPAVEDPRFRLSLLGGPGVEIVVRLDSNPFISTSTWSLPKALISHYSLRLRDACLHPAIGDCGTRITLAKHDPSIFKLFVEWLYYGQYTAHVADRPVNESEFELHAEAWVMGGQLRAVGFQDYAMTQMYVHCAEARSKLTPGRVKYALENSRRDSKLRQFHLDFVTAHFADKERVGGTIRAWDVVLQCDADARLSVLRGYRMTATERTEVFQRREAYMIAEEQGVEKASQSRTPTLLQSSLGKRDADGMRLKIEEAGSR
ncbi:hypothetical protein NX059_006355 [Plenodomus lindquistii]|nr:hypothetical protein NX059_006355 [Plenodomus lindquistii]